MTDAQFETRLRELTDKLDTLPPDQRERILPLVEETRQRHQRVSLNSARARERLDDWRLQAKYNIFDAECRLRECKE